MHQELARAVQSFPEIPCLILMLLQQNRDFQGQLQPLWDWTSCLAPDTFPGQMHGRGTPEFCKHLGLQGLPPEIRYASTG